MVVTGQSGAGAVEHNDQICKSKYMLDESCNALEQIGVYTYLAVLA
jgi:hypothetical protein